MREYYLKALLTREEPLILFVSFCYEFLFVIQY